MTATRRLNADQVFVVALTILLALAIAAASFVLSFHGLRDVATWGRVPLWLAWLVPVMIDAAVLCYTLAWLVQRARRESVWLSWSALALFIAVSTLGNTLHGWHPSELVQRIVGTAVVGLAPLAMLLAVHTLAQLLTERVPRATDTATASTPTVSRVVDLDAARRTLAGRRHVRARSRRQSLAAKVRELRDGADPAPSFETIGRKLKISKSRAHQIYTEATS